MKAFKNWGRNIRWTARRERPDDLQELRAILTRSDKINVAGHAHSFSGIVRSEGVTMQARGLGAVVRRGAWDPVVRRTRVHVDGQISVGEAYAHMEELDLAVPSSGSSQHPSVIGAAATAVHGSEWRFGSMSHRDSLRAVRGIDGRGRDFSLDALHAQDEEALMALRAHLGGCGFIRGVQLAAVPTYRVSSLGRMCTLREALEEAQHAALRALEPDSAPERYEVHWFPDVMGEHHVLDGTALQAWRVTTQRAPTVGVLLSPGFIKDVLQGNAAVEGVLLAGKAARLLGDDDGTALRYAWRGLLMAASSQESGKGLVEPWHLGLTGPRLFQGVSLEYALEPEHLLSALTALHALVAQWSENSWYTLDLPINLRWTGGDEGVCMSAAHRGPTAWVDITVSEHGRAQDYGPFLYACEQVLVEHGGLPHLGKAHWISPRARWDQDLWQTFWSVRDAFDPDGRFLNAHLADLRAGRDLDPGLAKRR